MGEVEFLQNNKKLSIYFRNKREISQRARSGKLGLPNSENLKVAGILTVFSVDSY